MSQPSLLLYLYLLLYHRYICFSSLLIGAIFHIYLQFSFPLWTETLFPFPPFFHSKYIFQFSSECLLFNTSWHVFSCLCLPTFLYYKYVIACSSVFSFHCSCSNQFVSPALLLLPMPYHSLFNFFCVLNNVMADRVPHFSGCEHTSMLLTSLSCCGEARIYSTALLPLPAPSLCTEVWRVIFIHSHPKMVKKRWQL